MVERYYYKEGNFLYFGFKYEKELVEAVKELPQVLYNPMNKEWYVELAIWKNEEILNFIRKFEFEEYRPQVVGNCPFPMIPVQEKFTLEEVAEAIEELHLKRKPRDYQIQGIHYILNHGNCINGDDCGLGKTGQMIIVLELLDLFPCLIITPASVKYGWKKEWGKWTDREVNIIDTTNKVNIFDAPVNVINYDILGRKNKEKGSIDYVFKEIAKVNYKAAVWDEIHFAKNYKSIRGKISRKLARRLPAVFGLSGSLIMNRPEESINPLNIIKMFDVIFPSLQNFQLRYCNAKRTTFGVDLKGHHNVLELHNLLRNYCYIRREKREVLTELPPISSTVVDCGLTNTTQYHKAEKDLISYLQQVDVEKVEAAQRAEHLVKLSLLKTLVIKGKMKSIEIYIEEWLESNDNEKLVVFGTHREPLEKLAEKFNAPTLQGGLTAKKKMEIVEHFQVSDDRVIFCNIKAVGTGTDGLQEAASNIAFIELPDVYTDLEQAISRVERQGQKFSMNVAYLLCPDTIDTKLWNLLQNKKSVTDGVNKGIADESSINLELLKMYKV